MFIPILDRKESTRLKQVLLSLIRDSNPRVVINDAPFKSFFYPRQALKRDIGIIYKKPNSFIYLYQSKPFEPRERGIEFTMVSYTLGSAFENGQIY